jgi:hypothetical protein
LSVRLCAFLIASVLAQQCLPGNHRHFALESETVKVLDLAELEAERMKGDVGHASSVTYWFSRHFFNLTIPSSISSGS